MHLLFFLKYIAVLSEICSISWLYTSPYASYISISDFESSRIFPASLFYSNIQIESISDYCLCPNIQIKDRIRRGYPHHIRSFINNLAQALCLVSSNDLTHRLQIAIFGLLLTAFDQHTLGEYSEGSTGPSDGGESTDTESSESAPNESGKSNVVVDEIDFDEWEITIGTENAPPDASVGVLFDRYSSDNQKETGCIGRVKTMLDIVEERDIPLYEEPIIDVAKSGKNTDREGLRRVIGLVQHPQVKYLFVHDITRIARRNAFCLYLIDVLVREADMEVVTHQGSLDLHTIEGLALTWVMSLTGEIENKNKAKHTLQGQIETFEQGEYTKWYKNIPLGYSESDTELLEVNQKEAEAARAAFRLFNEASTPGPYKETIKKVNSQFGEHLEEDFDRNSLKRMLRDPVYIGRPTVEGESIGDQGQRSVLDKPELQLIDEELFESVNKKISNIEEKRSSDSAPGEVMDFEFLLSEFGLIPVEESTPEVAILCPECDSKMVRDGSRELKDQRRRVPIYKCQSCDDDGDDSGSYKKYPNIKEFYKIQLFDKIIDNIEEVAQGLDLDFDDV